LLLLALTLPLAILAGVYTYRSWTARLRLQRAIVEADRLDPGWTFAEL
jgi:hypothetical protein